MPTKLASTLQPGDRILDRATGRIATILDHKPIRSEKWAPGKISYMAVTDEAVVKVTLSDTDRVTILPR